VQILDGFMSKPDSYEDLSLHVKTEASKFDWELTAKRTLLAYVETARELK
jgi:hypothetical protein